MRHKDLPIGQCSELHWPFDNGSRMLIPPQGTRQRGPATEPIPGSTGRPFRTRCVSAKVRSTHIRSTIQMRSVNVLPGADGPALHQWSNPSITDWLYYRSPEFSM